MKQYIKADVTGVLEEPLSTRHALAENPRTNPRILARLAFDDNRSVREALVRNPNAPASVFETLATKFIGTDRTMVFNPNCPEDVLRKLIDFYRDVSVERAAADDVLLNIARSPNAPQDFLATAATSKDYTFCLYAAENPRTPADTLVALAKNSNPYVVGKVVQNPSTPMDIVNELMQHPKYASYAIYNTNLPFEERVQMANYLGVAADFKFDIYFRGVFAGELYPSIGNLVRTVYRKYRYQIFDINITEDPYYDEGSEDYDPDDQAYSVHVSSAEIVNIDDMDSIAKELESGFKRMGLDAYNFDWY